MCLSVISKNRPKAKIAEEDIICYKVLRVDGVSYNKRGYDSISFVAPYTREEVTVGKKIHDTAKLHSYLAYEKYDKFTNAVYHIWEIREGGFHTFANFEDAKIACMRWSMVTIGSNYGYIVVYAIIPKGTKYHEGTCEEGRVTCYVSKDIIYTYDVAWTDYSTYVKFRHLWSDKEIKMELKNDKLDESKMANKTLAELSYKRRKVNSGTKFAYTKENNTIIND